MIKKEQFILTFHKALQLLLILLILKILIWAEMHELFIYHTQAE
jgi:hypothetical protein